MKHTKKTDHAALKRIIVLGARSLDPESYNALEAIVRQLHDKVEVRRQDEQEDEGNFANTERTDPK